MPTLPSLPYLEAKAAWATTKNKAAHRVIGFLAVRRDFGAVSPYRTAHRTRRIPKQIRTAPRFTTPKQNFRTESHRSTAVTKQNPRKGLGDLIIKWFATVRRGWSFFY